MPVIVCFEGRLAADPELAHTTVKGTAVTEAVAYVNRRVRQGEEWVDAEPTRYWIKAWKRRAEQLAQLSKGTSIVVIGHVETDSWTDTESGEKRYRDTVVVDAIGATLPSPAAQD